jgi:DNA-binding NtrC family response regulator
MNATTALPAHLPPNSNVTAKSGTASNTGQRPTRRSQGHPRWMHPGADWTAVKVLTPHEVCDNCIRGMLNRCGRNRKAPAQFLGMRRTTLYRDLRTVDSEK